MRLAVVALISLSVVGWTAVLVQAAAQEPGRSVVVRDAAGLLLAQVPLDGPRFAVSYRNSLYKSVAEERYDVLPDNRFQLVELAADEVAVLEEYYMVPTAAWRAPLVDRRQWLADPDAARPADFGSLNIAATDLGERTLHVPGRPAVALWQLVGDVPTVVLAIEENR